MCPLQSGAARGLSVFVGDSPSDLAALLAADLGIVVGGNKLLRRVASAAGIRLEALVAGAAAHPPLFLPPLLPQPHAEADNAGAVCVP